MLLIAEIAFMAIVIVMLGLVIYKVMKQNENLTAYVMRHEDKEAYFETQSLYDVINKAKSVVPESEKSDGKTYFDVYLSGEATDNDEKMFGVKYNKAE